MVPAFVLEAMAELAASLRFLYPVNWKVLPVGTPLVELNGSALCELCAIAAREFVSAGQVATVRDSRDSGAGPL